MSFTRDTTPLMTDDEVQQVRTKCRTLLDTEAGLTHGKLALDVGVKEGTFSPWLGGVYQGRNDKVAVQVKQGLASRERGAKTRASAPKVAPFIETPTAATFFGIFEHAQHMPDFAVIVGDPGVGKTSACCAYTARNPNVYKIVCRPSLNGPRALLDDLARTMTVLERGVIHRVAAAIMNKLRNANALIIVDEAHHLTSEALDELRAIHDTGVGVCVVGNATMNGNLTGGQRASQFAQLSSRVGIRVTRSRPRSADVLALLDAWDVTDTTLRDALRAVSKRPGALRSMDKVHRLALMIARGQKEELSVAHIELADSRLRGAQEAA
ncbi:MAG: hypothetical protein JWP29_5676 [Rhodoferax sp.]|nr:hypothetical protein [Rhodoferax sp.]